MTDFLGRLISRSLPARDPSEARGELSPRLPSLFEPLGPGISAPEDSGEGSPQHKTSETERSPFQSESIPSRTLVSPTRADLLQTGSRAEERSAIQNAVGMEKSSAESQPITQTVPPADRSPIQPRIFSHGPVHSAETDQDGPVIAPTIPGSMTSLPLSAPLSRQERRSEKAAALVEQPARNTVRINIGRVEVRAVHPPQPPAPPRKTLSQTRLTIEEYSKLRNEGKR